MTQVSVGHSLVERLARLRGKVRIALGLFGAGILIAAVAATLLVLILSDYLLHFSMTTRALLLLAWLVGISMFAWRILIAPLSTRLTDQFLASRVENLHGELADELISAVHFVQRGTAATNAFAARHVESATRKTESMSFEQAIDFRRSAKAIGIALLTIVIIAAFAGLSPDLARIAMARWFSLSAMPWPQTTQVDFVWGTPDGKQPAVVPIGEQLLVRAKVTRGGYAEQRVLLTAASDSKSSVRELMTYQTGMSSAKERIYERTLEPDGEAWLSLKLEAGDDRDQEPVKLRLAARPVISEMFATITPPAYVKQTDGKPAAVIVDLLSQSGRAVDGSTISLRIRSTKSFALAAGIPDIRLLDQDKDIDLPLAFSKKLLEANLAEVTFIAKQTLQARVAMRDSDGFLNRVGGTLTLEVVPDGLPSVVITEPRRVAERSPTAIVDMSVQATDDLGLDDLKLVAEKFDAKPGDKPVFETALPWTERTVDSASGNTTGRSAYTWDLTPLNLQPGTRLSFYVMVRDNYDVNGQRHPWVKSAALALQIRSATEIEEARRKELNEVKERIKLLKAQQEQTKAQTDAIQKSAATTGITTAQQKSQLADLAQQESQEASTANAIRQKAEQIKEDLRQNKMADSKTGALAETVGAGMKSVATDNMPKAATDLNKAHENAGNTPPEKQDDASKAQAQQTADAAKSASASQGQAIAMMDRLIDELGAAGDFEAARDELRKIQGQQAELDKRTREAAGKTLGRTPEELAKDLRDQLNRLAEEQHALAGRTDELLNKMQKASDQLKQNDPAASESLQKAVQAGQENQVTPSQGSAGTSISKNQMSSAASSQGQAQRGLQQMMDELDKNDKRQLEQLARQLRELIEEVRRLKENEEGINKDSVAAGATLEKTVAIKFGDRQGQLQMNTIVVQKKAENTKNAAEAAKDIGEASEHMSTAAQALYSAKQPDSLTPETKAIESLAAAIEKLEKEKKKVDSQLKEKDLGEFVRQYEGIRTEQQTIKSSSDKIEIARQAAADKQVNRLDLMQLGKMAVTQGNLVAQVNTLSSDEKLKEFAVVVWMNSQVTEAMGISQERLKQADPGRQLADAQQTSIDRLTDIIEALKEEQARESKFQNEGNGGGGSGKSPLVPPLAQLKLLKAMQLVINGKTTSVNKDLSSTTDDSQKHELQTEAEKLGKKQGEIHDIANKIIEQMKQ